MTSIVRSVVVLAVIILVSSCNGNLYPIMESCPCGDCVNGCECLCDDAPSWCGTTDLDADVDLDGDLDTAADGDSDDDRETDGEE